MEEQVIKRAIKKPQKREKQPPRDLFTMMCSSDLHVECVKELKFHPKRLWRFDYAIPEHKIALEVEGGVWTQGRHTRPQGFLGDIEKYNAATLMGWRLLRTTPDELLSRKTTEMLRSAITGQYDPEMNAKPTKSDTKSLLKRLKSSRK